MFVRIGFDSTIELVSFDNSKLVNFNGKFIYGFRNGDYRTGSQSDNAIGNPHGFIIDGIVISKNIKKVTEMVNFKKRWKDDFFGSFVSSFKWKSPVSSTKSSMSSFQFRNSDCETKSQSDNTIGSPHGFIIHWIEVFKGNEEVTEVIDVENWRIYNSRVLRWVVSLIKWNSSVSSTKFSIQSTFRFE
nr:hypothetical protein [Tanacetum cinerariifolium]